MDEMESLSEEIEFHEKFRGYDPDEVDAYVDRVRKTASLASGRIAELHERVDASESLIASGRVNTAEETIGRILILAQQTADAVVAEAEANSALLNSESAEQASATVAAANEQSSRILAEAETDRREMIRTAEADARSTAAETHDRLQADVSGLIATREYLEDDITILEKHVRQQRANLSLVVSSLTDLIQQPESCRLEPAPATSGVTMATPDVAETADTQERDVEIDAEELPATDEVTDGESGSAIAAIDEIIDLDIEQFDELEEDDVEVDLAPTSPEPPRLMTAADLDLEAESEPSAPAPSLPTDDQESVIAVPLFAEAISGKHSEHFTQHVVGLSEGEMLADDDDALSAFFDQDDDSDRSWFGRKG